MQHCDDMDDSTADRRAGVSLWDGASEETLTRALQPPARYCVEARLQEARLEAGGLFDALTLAITTQAAFRLPVANAFVAGVGQRLRLDGDLRARMLTVVHEAIMNAVLHGNLGLGSSLRDNLEHMARLQRIIERRLADTRLGRRVVFVEANWTDTAISLLVRDCGEGFAKEAAFGVPETGGGRGLCIIEAMSDSIEYLNGGSAIRIGFAR